MFAKKSVPSQLDAPSTIIGNGTILEAALLTGGESVRIDGEFKGNVDIDGNLVLGDTGSITGDVYAKYIVVAGRVNGNIRCDSVLHFASTARVSGDIEANSLIVDEGSQINGRYSVGELPPDTRTPIRKKYNDEKIEREPDEYEPETEL